VVLQCKAFFFGDEWMRTKGFEPQRRPAKLIPHSLLKSFQKKPKPRKTHDFTGFFVFDPIKINHKKARKRCVIRCTNH
jgi:hypothetical protein